MIEAENSKQYDHPSRSLALYSLRQIRGWMEAAGFDGYNEAEVFSEEYWATDQAAYVAKIKDAYLKYS